MDYIFDFVKTTETVPLSAPTHICVKLFFLFSFVAMNAALLLCMHGSDDHFHAEMSLTEICPTAIGKRKKSSNNDVFSVLIY